MRRLLALLTFCTLATACVSPTPYQALAGGEGVAIVSERGNVLTIASKANPATPSYQVYDYALRKAGEAAAERGKPYFVVLGNADVSTRTSTYVPITTTQVKMKDGGTVPVTTGGYDIITVYPGINLRIVMLDEPRFDFIDGLETLEIFETAKVTKYLGDGRQVADLAPQTGDEN